MNSQTKNLLKKVGFETEIKNVELGICPLCKNKINKSEFIDFLSIKEFKISGLCQKCQNNIFE